MDSNVARWSQVVFWSIENIQELHKIEDEIDATWTKLGKSQPQYRVVALFRELNDVFAVSPYWPEKMPLNIQAERMQQFERKIYPIWASINARHDAKDLKGDVVPTLKSLHDCDIAIFNSGHKPDRSWNGTDLNGFKAKVVAGERFGY